MLFHGSSSPLLSQPASLELVGRNSLHLEAGEPPTIQNSASKGANRHLVDLGGTASSHISKGFLVLPGYQGIHGSQHVSSLSEASLIESLLQNRKTEAPASFTDPPTLTPHPLHIFNEALKQAVAERSLVAMRTMILPCSQPSPL